VLAVKDECQKHSPPFRRSSILDSCARRDSQVPGNPAQDHFEDLIMNSMSNISFASHSNALTRELSLDAVRSKAPAVFAASAHERMSPRYTFIPTERVLSGLINVGFVPVDARQAHTRSASPLHARHVVRLRRRFETVELNDSVLEILFLNSHDGTSAYQLRIGIFRVVCTNGLIVSRSAFPTQCVRHRGNIVEEVVVGALQLTERFESLAEQIEHMEHRQLQKEDQLQLAECALKLRFPKGAESGLEPAQLLTCRRTEDVGDDLWRVTNRLQENLLRGGLARRTVSGRLIRTRPITAIREDVRINSGMWDLAMAVLAA
jgi:Domain of unknown function (DUF932)